MFWNWFGFGGRADKARCIFIYRDGTRPRRADPIAVEAALIRALGADWRDLARRVDGPPPAGLVGEQADEAELIWHAEKQKLLAAIDGAFGVYALNDRDGLTDVERVGLLARYCLFCAGLVEAARPFVNGRSRASPSPAAPPRARTPESTSAAT